jgi:ferredoxin-NADP reductase/DMSO/TMAO reductase YedYZ heme-binding membrane subunit
MRDTRFARLVLWTNGAVPGALLAYDAVRGDLGANPVNFAIRTAGMLTIVFLSLSLLVTPLRKITGWHWLVAFRRSLGLYAFFYGATHFTLFFVLDRSLSLSSTLSEMVKRPYLVVGSLGLLCLTLLAATSTNAAIRRLGARRWQALHRLAYVAVVAGVVHYYMLVKADVRLPIAFAVTAAILLGFRLVGFGVNRAMRRGMPEPVPAAVGRRKFWSGHLKVARISEETPEIRTFRLQTIDGTALPFDYLPGQYLNIGLDIEGKRVSRSYTMASSPSRAEGGWCEITVKREERGTASRYLHDRLHEGDLVRISAPAGSFTFTGTEADGIVLIGAGVGITPLMSVVRYLTDHAWPGEIHLIHCVRTERDAVFRDELTSLQALRPNLRVTVTLTRDQAGSVPRERGRISAELLTRVVPSIATRLVHICGPAGMMEATTRILRELGVPGERIKLETFERAAHAMPGAPAPARSFDEEKTAVAGNADPSVRFADSGKTVQMAPDESVLEAAETVGVNIEFECRSGICGRCTTRLLSGAVRMETRDALSPADERRGLILACQAKPVGPVTVQA